MLLLLLLLLRRTGNPVREERNSAVQTRLSLLGLQGVWKGMMEYPQNMQSSCNSVQDNVLWLLSTSGTYWVDAWVNNGSIRSKTLAMTTAQLR